MEGLARLAVVKDHLLGNFSFAFDSSLDDYRKRGRIFNPQVLHDYYYGVGLEHYKEFRSVFRETKTLSHKNTQNLSKNQQRNLVVDQIAELMTKLQFTRERHVKDSSRSFVFARVLFCYDTNLSVRLGVHGTLYIDSLLSLGTEKHFELLDRSFNLTDIGCFAMTELGHGSNVAGISTTATYIKETREFEIHTPNSYAAKWWIGGAAQTSNKAVVFAQLWVQGKHEGVHAFVIDIRDAVTNLLKPGVVIGDCGLKFENNGVDNGFIIFKNYRVPYISLLDKVSKITENGEFVSIISKKEKRLGRMLSSLIRGRTGVLSSSESSLKHALTIGIRWAAVRKQFGPPGSSEISILSYQLTRIRLMPYLSNLFAASASCELMYRKFDRIQELMSKDPECNELVEFHVIISACKVLVSEWAFHGIHECRKICGGIGYSSFSRLGQLLAQHDVNLTWEGDNNILLQQTSAFVVKQAQNVLQGAKLNFESLKLISPDFFNLKPQKASKDLLELDGLLSALKYLFNMYLQKTLKKLQENTVKTGNLYNTWNMTQSHLQNLGRIFGVNLLAEEINKKLQSLVNKDENLYFIVLKITKLFIVDKVIQWASELLGSGYLDKQQFEALEEEFNSLCSEIGENCVNIIDAIADEDFMHGSSIGTKDGQAYAHFTQAVESQPECYQSASWKEDLKKRLSKNS
jgi:acyl-CoA oxidase